METVQLQCGNCKKLMAIGVEHLGEQVQCPHCKSVVQTPAPAQPSAPDPDLTAHESVAPFPSDAVSAEMPPPAPPAAAAADEADETALPKFKPRPVYDRSLLPIIGLIFLVPYAFFATLFILYLIFFAPPRSDPLENLRDPAPNPAKGGAKRVERPKHDQPLASRWHTTLGKPIQAGSLLVTPQKIRLKDGDLQLVLRVKNTSAHAAFEPIHPSFVKLDFRDPEIKPYSFIEAKGKSIENVYGMDPSYHRDPEGLKDWSGSTTLRPGEEITITLNTYERYRAQHVATIVKSGDDFTWRVHVRRGFVRVDNRDVSATMVIGVDFSSTDIEGKKA
jgi:phage FluMu protein Com